ncbi:Holliday junction branch migration protein RuvA [Puniceicoccales bacterium CK1056]|uniref:Holliday junction branch migration complex subunit RuvA n=1 Tax=Oceanipulchritudo coccoides TaxID=2706888 RepID=A0A6B2LYJ9_9BACT|nr:Holliday junction branch migration protein RuvA [Oceanipulchritudo coccoides]NDV61678.1 Holliday junction branch migration protein RuvA [Oceanipulchritudo coccoides]
MISFIEGVVESATPLQVILNCQGIGYRIDVPVTTSEKIPGIGKSVRLQIHPVYREDSQALYGFATREERDFFHLVTSKVSGIGPKIALNLMSRLSFQMLQDAISRGDAALLAKCPGIGKKTAERVCIELKDKLGPGSGKAVTVTPSSGSPVSPEADGSNQAAAFSDAIQALMTLGYKMDAADQAVRKASQALGSEATTDALIKMALKTG